MNQIVFMVQNDNQILKKANNLEWGYRQKRAQVSALLCQKLRAQLQLFWPTKTTTDASHRLQSALGLKSPKILGLRANST